MESVTIAVQKLASTFSLFNMAVSVQMSWNITPLVLFLNIAKMGQQLGSSFFFCLNPKGCLTVPVVIPIQDVWGMTTFISQANSTIWLPHTITFILSLFTALIFDGRLHIWCVLWIICLTLNTRLSSFHLIKYIMLFNRIVWKAPIQLRPYSSVSTHLLLNKN